MVEPIRTGFSVQRHERNGKGTDGAYDRLERYLGGIAHPLLQKLLRAWNALVDSDAILLSVRKFGAKGNGTHDDQSALEDAVSAAYSSGATLYWPPGTYLSTGSIANLHSVRHIGPGAIVRGSVTFYLQPTESQSNALYISATGDSANDGLTSSEPVDSLNSAAGAAENYGPVLRGTWTIWHAAGTYSTHTQYWDVPSKNVVQIRGPSKGHPNVPTAIYDGTGTSGGQHGMHVRGQGVWGLVRDIKFQNYTASTTQIGLVGEQGCTFQTLNVHANGSSWTNIYAFQCLRFTISDGILESGRSNFIANACSGTFGAGNNRIRSLNATQSGVYWSRGAQGHIDNADFDGDAVSVDLDSESRAHVNNCDFGYNGGSSTYHVRCQNSEWYDNGNTVTTSATTSNYLHQGFGIDTDSLTDITFDRANAFWGFGTSSPSTKIHAWEAASTATKNTGPTIYAENSGAAGIGIAGETACYVLFSVPNGSSYGEIRYVASDDTLRFRIANADTFRFSSSYFQPQTDNSLTCGATGQTWSAVWSYALTSDGALGLTSGSNTNITYTAGGTGQHLFAGGSGSDWEVQSSLTNAAFNNTGILQLGASGTAEVTLAAALLSLRYTTTTSDDTETAYSIWTAPVWLRNSTGTKQVDGIAVPSASSTHVSVFFYINRNSGVVTWVHQSGSAADATNRIISTTGSDIAQAQNEIVLGIYDPVQQRCRMTKWA